jgi:hypothetical protein
MLFVRSRLATVATISMLAACSNPAMPMDGANADAVVMETTPDTGSHPDVHPDVRPDVHHTSPCAGATDCDTCVGMNSAMSVICGWSASQMMCIDASPSDPTMSADGTSTGADWAPLPQYCPSAIAFCAGHSSTCLDCTGTPFCGMCAGTTTCVPGTNQGPLVMGMQHMCTGAWYWLTTDCPSADAGPTDSGPTDSGPTDSGPVDSGPADAGPRDSGPADAGPADAGPVDASTG